MSIDSVWINTLLLQYGLQEDFLEKFCEGNLPPKTKVFLGEARPGKPACSTRGLEADRTARQSRSKAGESKVDLDTDADRGQGEESPRFQLSENKIAIPARGYFMLVSCREVRQ